MATHARLMTQLCTCGATGACTCTARPFGAGEPSEVQASAVQDLDRPAWPEAGAIGIRQEPRPG
jgi:hypothetical protein